MEFYNNIYIVFCFSLLIVFTKQRLLELKILQLWCFFFAIVGGFRWHIGGDFDQGIAIFEYVKWSDCLHFIEPGSSTSVEPLYSMIHMIIKATFGKYHFVMFIICSFLQFSYYRMCKNLSPQHPMLLYALFMVGVRTIFPVRAGFALAFIFWAYIYLSKGNTRAFIIMSLLALGIHNMSLMLIPVYIFYRLNYSIKLWQALGIFIVCIVAGNLFQSYFTILAFLLGGDIGTKVQTYSEWETEASDGGKSLFTLLSNAIYIIMFYIIGIRNKLQTDRWYNTLMAAALLSIGIKVVFADGMADLVRLIDPIAPCLIILQGIAFIEFWEDKHFKLFARLLFIVLIFKNLSAYLNSPLLLNECIPYKSIFDYNISLF